PRRPPVPALQPLPRVLLRLRALQPWRAQDPAPARAGRGDGVVMGRRDDIRRRLEAATPTPWVLGDRHPTRVNSRGPYCDTPVAQAQSRENAALIAHAPSDLRDLLAVADQAHHYRNVVAAA